MDLARAGEDVGCSEGGVCGLVCVVVGKEDSKVVG